MLVILSENNDSRSNFSHLLANTALQDAVNKIKKLYETQ